MTTVGDIMIKKPVVISPDESVEKAATLMEKFKVGGLPVIDGSRIVGIITSRDVRRSHPNRLVADAMTKDVFLISPESSLWEAKEFMERHDIERLIIAKDNKLAGIATKSQLYIEIGKHIDTLTNLYRSEFLQNKAMQLLQEGHEIAIIFIDLNNFRTINKEMGHVFGDLILKQVAQIFKDAVEEETDYLCRYAGDEFAVVTVRPLNEAIKLGLKLITSLTSEEWPNGLKITASAGVAGGQRNQPRYEINSHTIDDLINLASLGSTKAKKEGVKLVVVKQAELIKLNY